jgi:hypothetical protein
MSAPVALLLTCLFTKGKILGSAATAVSLPMGTGMGAIKAEPLI